MKNKVLKHPQIYLLLFAILALGFFLRVYRLHDLLAFYYDQGRDALVIWNLWHEGKLFLIGPVTGLAGIFLGPFYYYLISPFYLIGAGSPVVPAVFLAVPSILAVLMLYFLGWKFHSREAGVFAAIIGSFSYYLVLASRWLSNPTPLLLSSMLLIWSMWEIARGGKKWWWFAAALLVGLSLQFEVASALFFLPMMLVFALWQRKRLPGRKTLAVAFGVFLLTLLPQILFNFRHDNILFKNFYRVLFEEKSFSTSFWEVLALRRTLYWNVFYTKIMPGWHVFAAIFTLISAGALFVNWKKISKNVGLPILILFIATPVVGLLLFQGNYGNVWDYYMTGSYLPLVLLFSIGLAEVWRRKGFFAVLLFFALFFVINGFSLRNYLRADVHGPTHITLGNQLQSVHWVFRDAQEQGENFNVDVYVPPVIPYAYDYLFLWQATEKCGEGLCGMQLSKTTPLLYTLYEVDPPHPERLEAWLARQEGIGDVEERIQFGGITVERRIRK